MKFAVLFPLFSSLILTSCGTSDPEGICYKYTDPCYGSDRAAPSGESRTHIAVLALKACVTDGRAAPEGAGKTCQVM